MLYPTNNKISHLQQLLSIKRRGNFGESIKGHRTEIAFDRFVTPAHWRIGRDFGFECFGFSPWTQLLSSSSRLVIQYALLQGHKMSDWCYFNQQHVVHAQFMQNGIGRCIGSGNRRESAEDEISTVSEYSSESIWRLGSGCLAPGFTITRPLAQIRHA